MGKFFLTIASCLAMTGCGMDDVKAYFDPNSKAVYGVESGLPVNCRALIADATDAWKAKTITADLALQSIYDNCGRNGYNWGR
jgi:hypothetical protein